ncbi:MAG: methionyl-tRNA formyltransferase [Candidatus Scalindua sp.]
MKTIFMGNHTVGVIVLKELMEKTDVSAVFAHPDHPDDGTFYLSVKNTAKENGISVYQPSGKEHEERERIISEISPDLIVVADYRFLLKKELVDIPKYGAINFHPSLLPKYRGRAPVNWAIINGEKRCGLTVHYIDEGMDTGDIILQKEVEILFEDTIKDIHEKLFPVYKELAKEVINLFIKGVPPPFIQDHPEATEFPRRTPDDGLINWSGSNIEIYNFMRAITHPYPGAFSFIEGVKYLIWSSSIIDDESKFSKGNLVPGEICSIDENGVTVKTGDGLLLLSRIQQADGELLDFKSLPFTQRQTFTKKTVG